MNLNWPFFLYGGDYNPEQWPREVWREDASLMNQANWNVATLPVFGWASMEPSEGVYTFEWLDTVLDDLTSKGIKACLATATASVPAWLTQSYPEVLVVGEDNVRRKHGNRHTFCPNSPQFKRLSANLTRKIAERYADHPALLLWHISNEYGTSCYCDLCAQAFRDWLKGRYGSLENLNDRWNMRFWGHQYSDWSQIDTPTKNGEQSSQSLKIDYNRFQSASLLGCLQNEAAVLREVTPNVPITTNLMGSFFPLDYREWAKELDIVSWDNYPYYNAKTSDVAFAHALMRGLKEGQPFLLMEQSPSQQNWAPYNRLKQPGQLRLQSFQAVAHGADSVMYFQWRRGRGGIEKLHGAVMEHGGSPANRVFQEVSALGGELIDLGARIQGARSSARVALLFDWPNWWGLAYSSGPSVDLDYPKVVRAFYGALHSLGIQVEVLSPDADLSGYDVIVAPLLTMVSPGPAEQVVRRVAEGATLVATTFTGLSDDVDLVFLEGAPGPWRKVLGLSVEETDALPPELPNGLLWSDGVETQAVLLADRIRLEGAEVKATYASDFYQGEAAVTRHQYEKGEAWYLAAIPDQAGLLKCLGEICSSKGITSPLGVASTPGLEVTERVTPSGESQVYLLNHGSQPVDVALPAGRFRDLLGKEVVEGSVTLEVRGVRILVREL